MRSAIARQRPRRSQSVRAGESAACRRAAKDQRALRASWSATAPAVPRRRAVPASSDGRQRFHTPSEDGTDGVADLRDRLPGSSARRFDRRPCFVGGRFRFHRRHDQRDQTDGQCGTTDGLHPPREVLFVLLRQRRRKLNLSFGPTAMPPGFTSKLGIEISAGVLGLPFSR